MELSCDIVMDLITLYHDGLTSESSNKAIKTHLKSCPTCRKAYREYKLAEVHPSQTEMDVTMQELNDSFSYLAKRLRKRHYLITSGISFYILLSLVLLGFYSLRQREEQQK